MFPNKGKIELIIKYLHCAYHFIENWTLNLVNFENIWKYRTGAGG